jgi:hypothetical protein
LCLDNGEDLGLSGRPCLLCPGRGRSASFSSFFYVVDCLCAAFMDTHRYAAGCLSIGAEGLSDFIWVKVGGNVSRLAINAHCHLPTLVWRMDGGVRSAMCVCALGLFDLLHMFTVKPAFRLCSLPTSRF